MAYDGLSLKTLRRLERQFARHVEYKKEVMGRHQPGTSWHTRASLEAETYQRLLCQVREAISKKGG